MTPISHFPNSARAAWLLRNAKRPRSRVTDEERELRLLARELGRDLRHATKEQLHLVAQVLGRTPRWIEMVSIEARRPGMVGKACLRAVR